MLRRPRIFSRYADLLVIRMLRPVLYPILLTALIATAAFGGAVLSRFEARTEGNDVVVQWQTSLETDVREYVLERKTRVDADFRELKRVNPHGVNRPYIYKDTQIHKATAEQVQYRLRILNQDGSFLLPEPVSVNYTPTAVRRTWGSIKAMFQ